MSNSSSSSGSIGFGGLLAIVFITLKLCGVINWSWWWVLCPIWGPVVILLAIAAVGGAVYVLASLAGGSSSRRNRW